MKKLVSIILILLSICILFPNCGKKPTGTEDATPVPTAEARETGSSGETSQTQPSGRALTYEEVYNPDTDYNNAVGRCSTTIVDIGDAYLFTGGSAKYLYYYDKALGESSVLCPKPECIHDEIEGNVDCAGYLGGICAAYISYYMGHVYYLSYGSGIKNLFLYRLDPYSTAREQLFKLEFEPQRSPSRAYIHRGKLYCSAFHTIVRDGVPMDTWSVSGWDLETGEYKLIYEEDVLSLPCLFFFGKYVYFCASSIKWKPDNDEEMDTQTIKIFRYDSETDSLETVLNETSSSFQGSNYQLWVAAEDRIYVAPYMYGSNHAPTAVYQVSNGKLIEVARIGEYLNTTLFGDMIVNWGKENDPYHPEKPFNCRMLDYDGNVLFEGEILLDIPFSTALLVKMISVYGIMEADGALFISYYVIGQEELGEKTKPYSCMVKYELIDGKLEETLIGVAKWD